ncbi:DNA ligase 1 [Herrania umbratica]|uniref:DNA ligase 1 n=1 Tax=Herrania umbratica TaxID=108875 RepID=A0A6J1AAK3_9ROSI|nr:DNA ligase 1 [Herrania umbratica]
MNSGEDLELVSPSDAPASPVPGRKLKRLKKVKTVAENPSQFEELDFDISDGQAIDEPRSGSRSGFEGSDEEDEFTSGFGELPVEEKWSGSVAKRTLDFDSLTEEVDGDGEDQSREMEIRDSEREESEKKRPSLDELENREKKKKKRVKGDGDEEMPLLPERRTSKERREHLAQLRAESQRLLRETRDAAFKPALLVQKPISSVLEKIRRRKLEVSKKTYFVVDDHDGFSNKDMAELVANEGSGHDEAVEVGSEKGITNHGISDTLSADEIESVANVSSHEKLSPGMAVDEEPKQAFRAAIDDTQDLFSDSQTSDSKDDFAEETPKSPLEEVLAPSMLALNLKLDSAPADDMSSDEEDNDKENIDPQPHRSADLSPTANGDPVKAFIDQEAEEEDDSDNDLLPFQDDDNEEDEDSEDLEELRDMIATTYEEKQSDIEKRMELHQKLFDRQDAAKTENLLRRWGPKQRETTLLDEEGFEEEDETDEEEEDFVETTEDLPPTNLRMHIKKIKEMIPQMFTDKDDMYISSDDEEVEKKLAEQCLSEKANQQAELLPPTADARSKELFGYIKKVNNMPDIRRKAKPSSFSNMLFMGKQGNVSSKSSFIGRGSNCSISSSSKHGSGILRSFVFEREDSNSRSTTSVAENSSDLVQREHRPTKTASAKFTNSQIKSTSQPRKDETETSSRAQLLEILRRSSLQTSHSTHNSIVGHTESIFAAFKLEKKSVDNKANVSMKTV